jgi:hypothetical protein
MLKKLEMQENQISEITEGDFEGLSKFNSDYDCVVSTQLTDILLCAFLLAQTVATHKAVSHTRTVPRCYHAHNLTQNSNIHAVSALTKEYIQHGTLFT